MFEVAVSVAVAAAVAVLEDTPARHSANLLVDCLEESWRKGTLGW